MPRCVAEGAVAQATASQSLAERARAVLARGRGRGCAADPRSVLSFRVSTTCGLRPKARQIRETEDCDRSISAAIDRVDQCESCPRP
jgi:hypothetical protein